MQRRVSAPWIESLKDGLSCNRSPLRNQWMVLTTMSPAFFNYSFWDHDERRETPKATTRTPYCPICVITTVPSHPETITFSPGRYYPCTSKVSRGESPDKLLLSAWTADEHRRRRKKNNNNKALVWTPDFSQQPYLTSIYHTRREWSPNSTRRPNISGLLRHIKQNTTKLNIGFIRTHML